MPVISEVTHYLALLPLLWLVILTQCGQRRSVLWWLGASVLAVSWVADSLAHVVDPWLVSGLYPLAQLWLVGLAVLPKPVARRLLIGVLGLAIILAAFRGEARPDVLIRAVCWMGVVVILWDSPLRMTVVLSFGVCWIAWLVYSLTPGWTTWGIYQSIRAAGDGVFCYASARA